MDEIVNIVETNMGRKADSIAIVDIYFNIWHEKNHVPQPVLSYFSNFPLAAMETGDYIVHQKAFLIKVSDLMNIIVFTAETFYAEQGAMTLRGRMNALSSVFALENMVKNREAEEIWKQYFKNMNAGDMVSELLEHFQRKIGGVR